MVQFLGSIILPHYENPIAIQHVTFHLADSLPKAALERMEMELRIFTHKRQEEERRKRIEALRDAGHGSCVLRIPEIAQMVQESLFYFDGQRYRLIAWVVMPNHVHALFQPLHNWKVSKIVASWKKFTAGKIKEYKRRIAGSAGRAKLLFGTNANQEIGEPDGPGRAELPFGAPGKPDYRPYWHSRGYLPHYENPIAIQHVTFHLADSLPKAALERMEMELRIFTHKRQEEERRKRIEALRDAGHGSCVLRIPEIAQMVQESLFYFDGQRYRLIAWVVMPNHVHVLFQPLHNWKVSKIVASWKKFTAAKIKEYKRRIAGSAGSAELLFGTNANQEIGEPDGPGRAELPFGTNANQEIGDPDDPNPVWQREYWDRYMRNGTHMRSAIEYIHQNPVKAGLVARAEDWLWSSAYTGIANLLIGPGSDELPFDTDANQEIGKPKPGIANLPIGTGTNAEQEFGNPEGGEPK